MVALEITIFESESVRRFDADEQAIAAIEVRATLRYRPQAG